MQDGTLIHIEKAGSKISNGSIIEFMIGAGELEEVFAALGSLNGGDDTLAVSSKVK